MIQKLVIKNYLLIKDAELNFTNGLNIITGETGAGKTIILDALSLILGERADYSIIKNQNEKLIIEGIFYFKKNESVKEFISDKELDFNDKDGEIIIRRELSQKGTSRNFINDTPVNINDLKELGDLIIDIHSQNEHQSLLNKETQLKILDKFSSLDEQLNKYKNNFNAYKELVNKYKNFLERKNQILEKKSLLDFQLKEINNVNPRQDEEQELENELNKLENSEEIALGLTQIINLLYEGETNVNSILSIISKDIKKLTKFDNMFEKLSDEIESSYVSLKEISHNLIDYNNNLNFDAARIEQIRERLGSLNFLKKKYNLSVNELIKKAEDLTQELNLAENFDFEIDKLKKEIETQKESLYKEAENISKKRKKSSADLEKKVNSYLNETGLENAEFKVEFKSSSISNEDEFNYKKGSKTTTGITSKGIDDIEFFVRINKGADFSSLRKSASGGEISRIMLSIKASLSEKDDVPILVFDEIDAGISGRIANKVGNLLQEISNTHQIISITHLPQIAAKSNNHFHVSKQNKGSETITDIKTLDKNEKISEVAKMLSGEKVTDASLKSAKELINN
ncbi:MAG TPA: DNA repair protein RecN [Ignavibacteria bacterium]|nr:DNA repair protein RecN [Ignavibacteria bacterium]